MKIKLTFAFLWLFCISAIGQEEEKKEEIQYNSKKTEIGIDFQAIFRNNIPLGSSLVIKRRFGEKKFISKNEKKAVRLRVGGYGNLDILSEFRDSVGLIPEEDRKFDSRHLVFIYSGIEWQKQRKRFQYFYGIETGFSYFWQVDYIYIVSSNGVVSHYNEIKNNRYSIPLIGFGGVKFFISPELSISLESSFEFDFSRNIIELYRKNINPSEPIKFRTASVVYSFNYGWDYLSTLNLSYYF